ncbi:MAG: 3'-5' exonuclease, partial [Methanobrevibacter sp.]|nr:3'-5' exonuclease [Methanobrevibacter sp.]
MEKNVVILDIDYVTYEDKPVIRLFSKNGDENVILIDDTFEPYLYVVCDDFDECIEEIQENLDVVSVEKVTKKDFQIEKDFIKVTFKHPQELAKNRDKLRDLESVIQIREFDIPFYRRYLMDRDVIPMTEVTAVGEELDSFLNLDSKKHDVQI